MLSKVLVFLASERIYHDENVSCGNNLTKRVPSVLVFVDAVTLAIDVLVKNVVKVDGGVVSTFHDSQRVSQAHNRANQKVFDAIWGVFLIGILSTPTSHTG